MTQAEEFFYSVTAEIPDVTPGKMFGASCIKTPNGKAAAMYWRDFLVVKLRGDDMDDALRLDGAKIFEPMPGRKMNGWVQIPYSHKTVWKKYALISTEFVKTLPGK